MACNDPKTTTATRQEEPSAGTPGYVTLQIYSYITKQIYRYKAYIYQFSHNTTATLQETVPFGRSSRMFTYGGTVRGNIDVSFFELVNSTDNAGINDAYYRAQQTVRIMYPQYKSENTANSLYLQKAPLVRVFCPAYITNGGIATDEGLPDEVQHGLLCYITNLNVSVDRSADGAFRHSSPEASLSPKINYTMQLAPIDDFAPGFNEEGMWSETAKSWPMGFTSAGDPSIGVGAGETDISATEASENQLSATQQQALDNQNIADNILDPTYGSVVGGPRFTP